MRVFLDANILFSSANPKWFTGGLLKSLRRQGEIVSTKYAVEEARRNLAEFDASLLPQLHVWLGRITIVPEAAISLSGVLLPAKDQPILAAAVSSGCTHLLTGDQKHFGALMGKTIQGVRIVSQRLLAAEVQEKGGFL